MTPEQILGLHQLLGRIGYFHALFIEPVIVEHPDAVAFAPARTCCLHSGAHLDRPVPRDVLCSSAWELLPRIAEQHGAGPACPADNLGCCAPCTVARSAETIAATWILAQAAALSASVPHDHAAQAIARVLAHAFATQYDADCEQLDRDTTPAATIHLAEAHPLPLTAELLGCWADPATAPSGRLYTWLNHCSGVDDIRRITLLRSAA
ncbi:hypothetical protein KDK95_05840 [Actinospica sp. MGRD01-02]|uniref:Uncharacterized protein n=1 Tax=Actinospica acidithermotolerans TaxID=2828514 RepID=A0A941IHK9_9ACTN|nr:hypothetical protein [Actinospica acidithermotolerans]MBR7825822.1 hypothetical protein [Actinospica acidithermotolerans]